MKISCNTIQELIPLYVEKMACDDTVKLVDEHTKTCDDCKKYLEEMESNDVAIPSEDISKVPLLNIKKSIKNNKLKTVTLSVLIVLLFMLSIISHLSHPKYIAYSDSGIDITRLDDGYIHIKFSNNVTSFRTEAYEYNGKKIVSIEAWSSAFDKMLKKSSSEALIEGNTDVVYYCDYTQEHNMILAYGSEPNSHGGVITLPKLVLNYYFTISLILSTILGVLFTLLKRIRRIMKYIVFVPLSYMLSHLLLITDFSTYSAEHDFIFILTGSVLIYLIFIFGVSVHKQYK